MTTTTETYTPLHAEANWERTTTTYRDRLDEILSSRAGIEYHQGVLERTISERLAEVDFWGQDRIWHVILGDLVTHWLETLAGDRKDAEQWSFPTLTLLNDLATQAHTGIYDYGRHPEWERIQHHDMHRVAVVVAEHLDLLATIDEKAGR